MAALHALPGVRLQPHGLTERDKQHPLFRVLPEAAQGNPDPRRPYLDRPIDIAFFGNSSPRRDKFFARMPHSFPNMKLSIIAATPTVGQFSARARTVR